MNDQELARLARLTWAQEPAPDNLDRILEKAERRAAARESQPLSERPEPVDVDVLSAFVSARADIDLVGAVPGFAYAVAGADIHFRAVPAPEAKGFDPFYARVFPRLLNYVRRLGAGWDEAADIVQEAILDTFQRWDALERPEQREASAYRAARNLAARNLLIFSSPKRNRRASQPGPPGAAGVSEEAYDPIAAWEQAEEIRQLVATLPLHQGQVVVLRAAGLTTEEIAMHLDISPDAVTTTFKCATRALLRLLEAEEE